MDWPILTRRSKCFPSVQYTLKYQILISYSTTTGGSSLKSKKKKRNCVILTFEASELISDVSAERQISVTSIQKSIGNKNKTLLNNST